MISTPFPDDNRGVSPAVGYMFIIGFIVVVGLGLFLFGGQVFTGDEDPRIDAKFDLEIENTSHIEVRYVNGDDFTTDNTDELYIVGQSGTGTSIDEVMLYNESGVIQSSDPVARLEEGTLVVNASRAQDEGIEPGATMQIVWEPKGHDDLQIVIDELVVPSKSRILQVTDEEGAFDASVGVNVTGCEPQEGESC